MKFEVNLPGVEELTERVVEHVANAMMHGGEYEDGMRGHIASMAGQRLAAKVDAEVEKIVGDFMTKPIQPTNAMGEPVGDPITLRARIAGMVTAWLETKVDRDGKVGAGYSYNPLKTRAEWAIERAVEEVAHRELGAAVQKAANEVKAQLNGKVTEATAATVKRLLGLPS